jgi:predicted phage replisome organizer
MGDFKWIKIATDIFDNEKMLLIESLPNSTEIMLIWFKLLCLAGKNNHTGEFTVGGRPYTMDMFSVVFRRPIGLVEEAIEIFRELGMIEMKNEVVTVKNWKKHQSIDQMELVRAQTKDRVTKFREKQKAELKKKPPAEEKKSAEERDVTQDVTQDVTVCNADCNAIEKNREEKNREEKSRIEESMYVNAASDTSPHTADRTDGEKENDDLLKPISDSGRGVVYLTDAQADELTEKLGDELYNAYLERLSTFIIEKRARIKKHFEIILRWYEEDKREGTLPVTDSRARELSSSVASGSGTAYKKEEKPRYGSFDPTEAFRIALKRSFADTDIDNIDI